MPPMSSLRSRPPVPSACETPPPRLWMRQVTSCSPVPDAATSPMSPRRTTLAKPSGTPLTIAVPQSGPMTSRPRSRAYVLIARSSSIGDVVGEQHHVQAERERLHRLGGGVVARAPRSARGRRPGARSTPSARLVSGRRERGGIAVARAAPTIAASRRPPRSRRRRRPARRARPPADRTARPRRRSRDRRPAAARGSAGVAMMHEASATPSRARSVAPSCISDTESL